jgi:hypothetical protein
MEMGITLKMQKIPRLPSGSWLEIAYFDIMIFCEFINFFYEF